MICLDYIKWKSRINKYLYLLLILYFVFHGEAIKFNDIRLILEYTQPFISIAATCWCLNRESFSFLFIISYFFYSHNSFHDQLQYYYLKNRCVTVDRKIAVGTHFCNIILCFERNHKYQNLKKTQKYSLFIQLCQYTISFVAQPVFHLMFLKSLNNRFEFFIITDKTLVTCMDHDHELLATSFYWGTWSRKVN